MTEDQDKRLDEIIEDKTNEEVLSLIEDGEKHRRSLLRKANQPKVRWAVVGFIVGSILDVF